MTSEPWATRRLADLCESVDYGFTTSAKSAPPGPKFLRITDIVPGFIDWSAVPFCDLGDADTERFRLHDNDIVVARTGATTGVSSLVQNPPDAVFASYLVRLKVRPDHDARYIAYAMKGPTYWDYVRGVLGDKSAQPNASASTLSRAPIPTPPLPEQRAIAGVLGALDDKIEVNRKTARVLEGIARTVFTSWFVDFDPVRRHPLTHPHGPHAAASSKAPAPPTAPTLPKPLAALFPTRLVDSAIGEVPEGWRVGTLGELGSLTIGGDWGEDEPSAGATEAYCLRGVDLEHLRSTGQATPPRRWMKQSSIDRRMMDERDVLVAGSGAGPTGRPLWVCPGFMQTDTPVIYSNFCKRIRCTSAAAAVYLDAWLHRMRESGEIWEHVNGTSVPNLDANSLLAGKVVVIPPEPVLQAYYTLVRPMWEKLFCGENRTLAALRDALLPKLISGELRIADAEKIIGRV